MDIKKGDTVLIIKGKDRGKSGKVERVFPSKDVVAVQGVNIYKKHAKATKKNPHGGIMDVTRPVSLANAAIICPHCSKPSRVGHQDTEKGKIRICRRCQETLDQAKE